jgi:hypothetical protein
MDAIDSVVDPLREFAKDSVRLVKRCHKPDRKGRERLASSRLVSSLRSIGTGPWIDIYLLQSTDTPGGSTCRAAGHREKAQGFLLVL